MFLLIIGCGRSGTTYTTYLLRANDIDVKHERVGPQGIVAGDLGARHSTTFSKALRGLDIQAIWSKATHVYHQVRSPLPTIISAGIIQYIGGWKFITESCPEVAHDNMLIRCMRYWLFWNQMCEVNAQWTFRLENIKELCQVLSPLTERRIVVPSVIRKNANTRRGRLPYPKWTWKDLENADADLCARIRDKAVAYGYSEADL